MESPQDGFEVDALLRVVAEPHREGIRTDDTELRHPLNWMAHDLPEWFDLDGRLAGLQEIPVRLQFRSVNLGPGFNQRSLVGPTFAMSRGACDVVGADGSIAVRPRASSYSKTWRSLATTTGP